MILSNNYAHDAMPARVSKKLESKNFALIVRTLHEPVFMRRHQTCTAQARHGRCYKRNASLQSICIITKMDKPPFGFCFVFRTVKRQWGRNRRDREGIPFAEIDHTDNTNCSDRLESNNVHLLTRLSLRTFFPCRLLVACSDRANDVKRPQKAASITIFPRH